MTDRQTDRQTDKQTDRQTHTHTQRHTGVAHCSRCSVRVWGGRYACSMYLDPLDESPSASPLGATPVVATLSVVRAVGVLQALDASFAPGDAVGPRAGTLLILARCTAKENTGDREFQARDVRCDVITRKRGDGEFPGEGRPL